MFLSSTPVHRDVLPGVSLCAGLASAGTRIAEPTGSDCNIDCDASRLEERIATVVVCVGRLQGACRTANRQRRSEALKGVAARSSDTRNERARQADVVQIQRLKKTAPNS